jgi:hypothetical protein
MGIGWFMFRGPGCGWHHCRIWQAGGAKASNDLRDRPELRLHRELGRGKFSLHLPTAEANRRNRCRQATPPPVLTFEKDVLILEEVHLCHGN